MTPFTNREAAELGRMLARLENRIERLEQGRQQSQLAYSSIENGSLKAYGSDGVLRQKIGRQDDGTFAVTYANGPKPPMPTDPQCSPAQLALVIYWDGQFRDEAGQPGDFARCDVHICHDDNLVSGDFEVGPATLYGSLLRESAVTIPLDNSIYWIKLVAVNTSDVASDPTPLMQGVPNAAHHIASKSIGAEQLESEIVLASKIISGDEAGQHWEMDPFGLRAYNSAGQQTIGQESESGDAFFLGSIASAESGQRIVFNDPTAHPESYGSISFYGADGAESASIHHYESYDSTSVGLTIESSTANPSPPGDSKGSVNVTPDGFASGTFTESNGEGYSYMGTRPTHLWLVSPEIVFDLTSGLHPAHGYHSVKFRHWKWDGTTHVYQNHAVEVVPSPASGYLALRWPHQDTCLIGNSGFHVRNNADNAYMNLTCWDAVEVSDSSQKAEIAALDYSPLHTVLSVPTKEWYKKDPETGEPVGNIRVGPMAEDMPEALRTVDDTYGVHTLSLGTMIGLLWEAVQELAAAQKIVLDPNKLPKVKPQVAPPRDRTR